MDLRGAVDRMGERLLESSSRIAASRRRAARLASRVGLPTCSAEDEMVAKGRAITEYYEQLDPHSEPSPAETVIVRDVIAEAQRRREERT